MKILLEELKSRFEQAKERISKFEGTSNKIVQSEKGKGMKKNEYRYNDL